MRTYEILSRVFPRSFTAKVFFVAFCGTHVPLIATIIWVVMQDGGLMAHVPVLLVTLVATLAGTAVTLLALRAVLSPLYRIESTMRLYEEDGAVEPLPFTYNDQIGRLMQRTNRLVLHVDQRLDDHQAEADIDVLTGIPNRRGFERRARRFGENAIMVIDIDRFKLVNDSHGHETGDRVLKQVAGVLHAGMRPTDSLARLGGEEFVVQLRNTNASDAVMVAERLRRAVEANVRVGGVPVTISIGVAEQHDGAPLAEAIRRADMGTYAAKSAGRNRVIKGPTAQFGIVAA